MVFPREAIGNQCGGDIIEKAGLTSMSGVFPLKYIFLDGQ